MNVFDFAMEMEDAGHEYYLSLAREATLPGLRTIFTSLAEDEWKHCEIFRKLKAGSQAQPIPETGSLDTAQNVFSLLPRGDETLKDMKGVLEAYTHAMKLEAKSFRFYEDAAAKESNAGVKSLLLQIAAEERKHFNILENIYNFVNAPNQHLEWGEFSNISEFRQFGRDADS